MEGESAQTNSIVMQILFLVALTLINAFFASAEMAIVSVNKNKMKMLANEGNKKAKIRKIPDKNKNGTVPSKQPKNQSRFKYFEK